MSGARHDHNPIHVTGNIWLSRQMVLRRMQDGSQIVNVCIKSDSGVMCAIEAIFLNPDGVYSYKDKPIGTIDSPEFAQFMKKYQMTPDVAALSSKPVLQNEEELYKRVSETYSETKSIKKTARLLNLSEEKTRRILFTTGDYTCDTHEKIMKLLKEEKTLDDVAQVISLSRHKIHAYLPYGLK